MPLEVTPGLGPGLPRRTTIPAALDHNHHFPTFHVVAHNQPTTRRTPCNASSPSHPSSPSSPTACETEPEPESDQPATTPERGEQPDDQPTADDDTGTTRTETTEGDDSPGATLEVTRQEPYGLYLTDADGRSLYLFEADKQGETTCYEACAQAWPPLTTTTDVTIGDGVDPAMVDTIERRDGVLQVTYNGHPLYYFANDQQPGDTNGQDVEGFGAEWYLVSPDGDKIEPEAHDDSPQ